VKVSPCFGEAFVSYHFLLSALSGAGNNDRVETLTASEKPGEKKKVGGVFVDAFFFPALPFCPAVSLFRTTRAHEAPRAKKHRF